MALSHYLNQCWLNISEFLWHSPEPNFTTSAPNTILYNELEIYTIKITSTSCMDQWNNEIPWAVVGFSPLLQGAHQCTKGSVQRGSQSHPSGCTLEVGRGQRHTTDAVPDHCLFQARLWTHCVWHSIQYQFTTTWQHPQRWAKTGTRGILIWYWLW